MWKFILLILLVSFGLAAHTQKMYRLTAVEATGTQKKVSGVIYGKFIQRLSFSSGGFPQDIRMLNLDSQRIYTFRVKGTFKSAKDNIFCYYIPPGIYELVSYWYTQSKWYGGMEFTEPILKIRSDTTIVNQTDSSYFYTYSNTFRFTVKPGGIHYAGTWDFSNDHAIFRNEKSELDGVIQRNHKKINFSECLITMPH
jgi:hypothetical protein